MTRNSKKLIGRLLRKHLAHCQEEFDGMYDLVHNVSKMFRHWYTPRLRETERDLKLAKSAMLDWKNR